MALTSLVHLAEPFANPATTQAQGAQTLQTPAQTQPLTQTAGNAVNAGVPRDQFVSSNQNPSAQASAAAAGLFTVRHATAFTPAADSLLARAVPTPATAANAAANAAAGPAAGVAAVGTAGVESQLQTLNNALQALGLSVNDIRKVDQIATRLNDFNPTSFTSLVYELVVLSQKATQPTAATAVNAETNPPTAGGEQAAAVARVTTA